MGCNTKNQKYCKIAKPKSILIHLLSYKFVTPYHDGDPDHDVEAESLGEALVTLVGPVLAPAAACHQRWARSPTRFGPTLSISISNSYKGDSVSTRYVRMLLWKAVSVPTKSSTCLLWT